MYMVVCDDENKTCTQVKLLRSNERYEGFSNSRLSVEREIVLGWCVGTTVQASLGVRGLLFI